MPGLARLRRFKMNTLKMTFLTTFLTRDCGQSRWGAGWLRRRVDRPHDRFSRPRYQLLVHRQEEAAYMKTNTRSRVINGLPYRDMNLSETPRIEGWRVASLLFTLVLAYFLSLPAISRSQEAN